MQIFTLNRRAKIICQYQNTRNGFKHTATLQIDGLDREDVKCCYLNRTWEAYEFQSVLSKLLEKTRVLSDNEKKLFAKKIKNGWRKENPKLKQLKTVSAVMALGDLFSTDQKGANDWKARMLRAGLEGSGLIMPDDWDQLTEDQKAERLDGAIKILGAS